MKGDRLVRALSLLFSVYSPLYFLSVFLILLTQRKSKFYLIPILLMLLLVVSKYQNWVAGCFLVLLCVITGLHNLWVWVLRRHYLVGSIFAYPLHPWLYKRVRKITGYTNLSRKIYELHIDSRLSRSNDGVRAGLRVVKDARRVSRRLAGQTAVGTTYEGALMQTATAHTSLSIKSMKHLPGVSTRGQRILYPHQSWDTFVWDF